MSRVTLARDARFVKMAMRGDGRAALLAGLIGAMTLRLDGNRTAGASASGRSWLLLFPAVPREPDDARRAGRPATAGMPVHRAFSISSASR